MTPEEKKLLKFQKALADALAQSTDGLTKEEFYQAFEAVLKIVKDIKSSNETEFEAIHQAVLTLSQRLKDDNTTDFETVKGQIKDAFEKVLKEQENTLNFIRDKARQLRTPKDGIDGKDAPPVDEVKLVQEILAQLPTVDEETPLETRDKLESLEGEERLDVSAIKGVDAIVEDLKSSSKNVRVGWGAHPLAILDSGTMKYKVARTINFGANLTVSVNASGVITIDATGGSLTELTATGTINSVNTTFTFVSKPTYVYVDGVVYRENEGWTWSSGTLTATVTKAPDYSIWGQA